jgi:hypothetical protein
LLSRASITWAFSREAVEDAALLAESLVGFDEEDRGHETRCAPAVCGNGCKQAAAAAALCLREVAGLGPGGCGRRARPSPNSSERLASRQSEVELSSSFERAIDLHRVVMEVEMAHNLHRDYEQCRDRMSAHLRELIERGRVAQGGRLCGRARRAGDAQRQASTNCSTSSTRS